MRRYVICAVYKYTFIHLTFLPYLTTICMIHNIMPFNSYNENEFKTKLLKAYDCRSQSLWKSSRLETSLLWISQTWFQETTGRYIIRKHCVIYIYTTPIKVTIQTNQMSWPPSKGSQTNLPLRRWILSSITHPLLLCIENWHIPPKGLLDGVNNWLGNPCCTARAVRLTKCSITFPSSIIIAYLSQTKINK